MTQDQFMAHLALHDLAVPDWLNGELLESWLHASAETCGFDVVWAVHERRWEYLPKERR